MTEVERRRLQDLLTKYRTLLQMRAQRAPRAQARLEMRALSTRFPGALRELDELPLQVIEARFAALGAVLDADLPPETWMVLQSSYHGFLRALLCLKLLATGRAEPPYTRSAEAWAADEPHADRFHAAAREQLAKPAGTRLNEWAFAAVAALHGVQPDAVEQALFLPARACRHT